MPYTNTLVPIFGSWTSCVDPSRITARLWRSWRTVDSAGTIRHHEAEDESAAVAPDGTFSFRGGPSFEDFPVPIPAADGIGLRIDIPEGPIFRSGILDRLPQGPPTDPNGYVNVFVLCEPISISGAEIAASVDPVPFLAQDGCTTVTTLNISLGNDVINVSGTATYCSLPQGITAAFATTVTLSPNADLRDSNRPIIVNVNPIALNFTGGGDVGSEIEAAILNALSGWIEPWATNVVRGYIQNKLDAGLAGGVGRMPPIPPGVTVAVRRMGIRPGGISIWAALGSFGNLMTKFPSLPGGPGSRCFIATAAYGSELAPEVQMLRELRDSLLPQTRWGQELFDEYARYYYRMSPAIAEEMRRDPEFQKVIRWVIVTPWVNYLKLLRAQPNWDQIDMDGIAPELRKFIHQFRADVEAWLGEIELPRNFVNRDPFEAAYELNILLSFIVRSGGLRYLDTLAECGELPLHYTGEDEDRLLHILRGAGRSDEEINRILHGVALPL